MSTIVDYTSLQTFLATWSTRADQTANLPQYIANFEAKAQRLLRARDMQSNNTAFAITAEYMPVPNDFIEVQNFEMQVSPRYSLDFMQNEKMVNQFRGCSGKPKYYCPIGNQFRFGPPPNGSYQATLLYLAKIPPLSATNPTNWLLTQHPDAYLYGSLLEMTAGPLQNDAQAQKWQQAMLEVFNEIKAQGDRGRWGGNAMAVRLDGCTP